MKKIMLGLLITTCFATTALADQLTDQAVCTGSQWAIDCHQGSLADLQSSGSATLTETKVLGDSHVSGRLTAHSAHLNTIDISGRAELINTTIAGTAQISGGLTASSSSFNVLDVSGSAHLLNSKVEALTVSGSMMANKTQFNSTANVSGGMTAANCNFAGHVTVSGGLKAVNANFKDDISASSNRLYFSASEINNITVESNNDMRPQQITLDNHSIVHGNIDFEAANGVIILINGSKIEGKVTGAKVTTHT